MTVRLTVARGPWLAQVAAAAAATPGVVPVVKGNGYGFGRATLHEIAATIGTLVCVGTIHELDGIPAGVRPVVLTPVRQVPTGLPADVILTVDELSELRATSWTGEVLIKLRSSMRRFGVEPGRVTALGAAIEAAGSTTIGAALHLHLAGTDDDRLAEVEGWLAVLPADLELWLSHLTPASMELLRARHPQRSFRLRCGTALWHASKRHLHLGADVLAVHPVSAGQPAGYRATPIPADGHLVIVGGGSSHGIGANDGGLSPFHFQRNRMALLEAAHMHASMCHVADGQPLPAVGDWVDVQRPLITTTADEIVWN